MMDSDRELSEADSLEQIEIQRIMNEEYEPIDRHYSVPLISINGIDMNIMIEDEIICLLVGHYRPFRAILLSIIMRKAYSRITRLPVKGTKSVFTMNAIKKVNFITYQTIYGETDYIVITTGQNFPSRLKRRG
jgi:hypothetical protein